MLSGTNPYILHRQRQPVFNTVNALVLRTVVHKSPLDILHPGNQQHIQNKDSNPHKSFDYGAHTVRRDVFFQQRRQEVREHHEDSHCQYKGKCHRHPHQQAFLLFLLLGFLLCHLLPFFLLEKTGGIGQRLHPENHGIDKIKDTPDERNLSQLLPSVDNALIRLLAYKDFSVRLTDCHGIIILMLHHDSF